MERKCVDCGAALAQDNIGELCSPCQKKRLDQRATNDEKPIDAQDVAFILGLMSAESVKRLARNGEMPPKVPGNRKWQWYKKDIDAWIKQKQQEELRARAKEQKKIGNRLLRRAARGLASNLSKCCGDPLICLNSSDKIGAKVYGQIHIIGTDKDGRAGSIKLAKVNKVTALKILKKLPKKAFPALIGITDWADLTCDRLDDNFFVNLETFF
jgi:predicted DNA-binding transcriptional regulator AlpA